jgi:CYTH domain-containing protein
MIEIEKRYLAKYLPADLDTASSYYLEDVYVSFESSAVLRLRRQDDKYMITKKVNVNPGDVSANYEYTIDLTAEEYDKLCHAPGRRVSKRRYLYDIDGVTYEIGVFDGELS